MNTDNPYAYDVEAEPSGKPRGQASSVPTSRFFVAWLCFFLVATVGGGIVGAIVGGILGAFMGAAGADLNSIRIVGQVVGFIVALPISFLCYWWSVNQFIVKEIRKEL